MCILLSGRLDVNSEPLTRMNTDLGAGKIEKHPWRTEVLIATSEGLSFHTSTVLPETATPFYV